MKAFTYPVRRHRNDEDHAEVVRDALKQFADQLGLDVRNTTVDITRPSGVRVIIMWEPTDA